MAEAEEGVLCSSLDVDVRKISKEIAIVPSVGVEPTLGGF